MNITIDSEKRGSASDIQYTQNYGTGCMVLDANELFYLYDTIDDFSVLDQVSSFIAREYHNRLKTSIWFEFGGEGFNFRVLYTIDKIVKRLITQHSFLNNNLYYRSGAMHVPENYTMYLKHCMKFNWIPLTVICGNSFEGGIKISESADEATFRNFTPRRKNKIFTCYNRSPRNHRLFIIAEILRRRLDSKAYFSAHVNDFYVSDPASYISLEGLPSVFPKNGELIAASLKANWNRFPIRINLNDGHSPDDYMTINDNDINQYTESYFHVITETKFFHDHQDIDKQHHQSEVCLDCFFVNEKTYKAIIGKVPFILVGYTGILSKLRARGYKTFSPYIDESYDLIENDEDRLVAIMEEITRLSKLSTEEWLEWQENVIPILKHNYYLALSRMNRRIRVEI